MAKPKSTPTKLTRHPSLPLDELFRSVNTSPTLLNISTPTEPALLHQNVTLLKFANSQILAEVIRATTLARYTVRQISDTALLLDGEKQDEIIKLLTKNGYEPTIIAG
jgi:hypothetical protein